MKVYDPNILSDHCLIYFGLSRVLQVKEENTLIEENTFPLEYRYIWSTERSECYRRELNSGIYASDQSAIDCWSRCADRLF